MFRGVLMLLGFCWCVIVYFGFVFGLVTVWCVGLGFANWIGWLLLLFVTCSLLGMLHCLTLLFALWCCGFLFFVF